MSYLSISNLYRSQEILLFRECWALEKVHGTSANVAWRAGRVQFSSGGASRDPFIALFDETALHAAFKGMGHDVIVVYGEAYGGKEQAQAWRYGPSLRFVAFEARVGPLWLAVPAAAALVASLGLEFVHYAKVSTDLAALDAERDAPSVQAQRNGVAGEQPREGVVLRPLIEVTMNNGDRIIAKHKRDDERETKTPRPVVDPARLVVLTEATAIADEWITPTRLQHVLQKFHRVVGIADTGAVIAEMIDDVLREGAGEFVDSKEVRAAISRRAALLFHASLKSKT